MKVFRSLDNLPAFKNAVITIGSFDGVHQGHQQILKKVNLLAHNTGGESIVITFHPHPRLVIVDNDMDLKLLSISEEKIALFETYGVDNVVIVPFTIEFSQQRPEEYIENFLIGKFHPKYVVIGYDHRFGAGRQGDINYLRWYAEREKFEVVEIHQQTINDIVVSSTKIRKALQAGKIKDATQLLQHYYAIKGVVIHGEKLGHTLGFPTANIKIQEKHKLIPAEGIYAAFATIGGKRYGGMMYIGTRPTITGSGKMSLEINIFDFNEEIYGKPITIEFVEYIRPDATFSSLDLLKEQLEKDKSDSLEILSQYKTKLQKHHKYPSVAVVILNYSTKDQLSKFLPVLQQTTYPNYRIIVADNGSTDKSVQLLKEQFPEIDRIEFLKNYGFAEGYNQALKQVDADYFVLLNSDVEVTPDWLNPMIELMEKEENIGAVQPKIRSYHNKDEFEYAGAAGGWMDSLGYPFARGRIFNHIEKDKGQYDDATEIFWATGAAFCITSKLFHDSGGFEGEFFAHWEEIDLCWRLKNAGYKIMVEPKSIVYHVGGGTLKYVSPKKTYLNFRNNHLTFFKNESTGKLFWLMPLRLILDGIAGLLFLTEVKFNHIWAIIKAHFYLYLHLPKYIAKRKKCSKIVERIKVSETPNLAGRYNKSIVWKFYVKGIKTFTELFQN